MFGFNSKSNSKADLLRRRKINRDPNNQIDLGGVSINASKDRPASRMSLHSLGSSKERGLAAKQALNYNRMSRLGSGESARKLQKESFSKLQKINSGRKSLSGGSKSSLRFHL